jgi:hypothetical protein
MPRKSFDLLPVAALIFGAVILYAYYDLLVSAVGMLWP